MHTDLTFIWPGTVENLKKKSYERESHSGRKKVRDEAMINRVREDIENFPKRVLKRGEKP